MGTANALHTHGTGTDGGSDAKTARHAQAGLLAIQGPTALDIRTGVLVGPGSRTLITGTSDTGQMTVSIAPHVPVTTRGVANGPYLGPALEASTKVNIAAAPGAGAGDRIDVVYFRQQDKTAGVPTPDTVYAPLYSVLTGTPGGGKPSFSAAGIVGAEELGTVTVSPGATATNGANVVITNTARQTVARGVPIPVYSQTERTALEANAYPGLAVVRLDLAGFPTERWITGTTWKRLGLDPVSAERTSGVSGLPINAASTGGPTGAGLTLPALPVGHIVVVELSTDFYVEGVNAPQNLAADIVPTGATRLFGQAGRALSMSSLRVSAHSRQQFRVDVTTPVTFGSTYTVGAGSPRAILQREDWTAWL